MIAVIRIPRILAVAAISYFLSVFLARGADPVIAGELKKWHALSLSWTGTSSFTETSTPNVFRDYRLNVTFTHPGTGKSYVVPGFWAADGDAANTSATSGSKWRVMFAPDEIGTWNYVASFRTGTDVALSIVADTGSATDFNGSSGSFVVGPTDKTGRDHRGKGRLRYVGKHHLQFAETGEYFLKMGPDSPENLLNYLDFDDQPATASHRKTWSAHAGDYNTDGDDYRWKGTKGANLLGALNYLSNKGMNVFSFIPFTVPGDDKNVCPHLIKGTAANPSWATGVYQDRFDVSRMDQWERIFAYSDMKGLYMHFKTLENESQLTMDGGNLGPTRKLYYRELIARYSHHLALNWNLGEEVTSATTAQKQSWAQYFYDLDPYHHLIVIHNLNVEHYDLIGTSKVTGMSLQKTGSNVYNAITEYRRRSSLAGTPWVVSLDESGGAQQGVPPDSVEPTHDSRRDIIWSSILSGGGGQETYFGYAVADSGDLTNQNWRRYDLWWDQCRYSLDFIRNNAIPFQDMANQNSLLSGATSGGPFCFAKTGESYVIYLKTPSTNTLNLSGASGLFDVRWFDPFNGGSMQTGSVTQVNGGGTVSIGAPPTTSAKDWVALVQKANASPVVTVTATDSSAGEPGNSGTFAFSRSGSTSAALTVNFTVAGSAASVLDYASLGTSLTFPAGQALATLTLTVMDDSLSENAETAVVTLGSGAGYSIGTPNTATITIADDEPALTLPEVSVVATDANAAEPSDPGIFSFTRTGDLNQALTVNYTVSGTATANSDYALIPNAVNFGVGQAAATVTVAVVDDNLTEPSETVVVSLTSSTSYTLGSTTSATVNVVDNEPSVVSVFQDAGVDGILVVEVENPIATPITENGQAWNQVATPVGFSGSGAMQALPNNGTLITLANIGSSPSLNYPVTFTKTGTHYIWIRGYAATSNDNSVIVGLNGVASSAGDNVSVTVNGAYGWNNKNNNGVVRTLNVTNVGLQVLNLWMREDGTVADKLLLTVTPTLVPQDSNTYAAWAGGNHEFSVDSNKDGVQNGLAWLLGAANPNVSVPGGAPALAVLSDDSVKVSFTMLGAAMRDGSLLYLEYSNDLGITDPWMSERVPGATNLSGPVAFTITGTSLLNVEAKLSPTESSGSSLFVRLRALK